MLSFHSPGPWGTQGTKPAEVAAFGTLLGRRAAPQTELLPLPSQIKVLLSQLRDERCYHNLPPHLYKMSSKTS